MKIANVSMLSFLVLVLFFGVQVSKADEEQNHLYEAAQANPALKSAFEEIIGPVVKESSWLKDYGTTAPSTVEFIDDDEYDVYWGCKPKDCISESYTVMYDPKSKKIVAGALVRNTFDGPNVVAGEVTWLGEADWERAKVLGKYLY